MILRILPALLVLAVATACKKKNPSRIDDAIAKFAEFTDRTCTCLDKACVDRVQEDMTKWSSAVGKQIRSEKPTEAEAKRMEELGRRYTECGVKILAASGNAPQPPPSIATTDEKITNGDRLIKLTYDSLGEHQVSKLRLSYVRADGTLDPSYGEAEIELGKPKPPVPADDPNRPIGAPVPARAPAYDMTARCPSYHWKAGVRRTSETSCLMSGDGLVRPKCSVREVWKRAIDKGAPPTALAVLEVHESAHQTWSLSIDDDPRDIHFTTVIKDDCEPTLEAPR